MLKRTLFIFIAQLLFSLSINAQTTQELRDSLTMIEGLIVKHPKAVKLHLRKAALHIDLNQWDKALDDYEYVIGLLGAPVDSTMPAYLTALYYRGYVNQHLRRYPFARKDYETLLKVTPIDMHALMGLTLTNLADGHVTEAFDDANRLVEMFPDTAQVYAVRCEVEDELLMPDAAIDDIQKAIELEKRAIGAKYPFDDDDDIVSYELTLFNLYMAKQDDKNAKQCLAYLEKNGTRRGVLVESYMALKKKNFKESARKYKAVIKNKRKTKNILSFSSE